MSIFVFPQTLTLITRGPGSVQLLSWQNNAKGVDTVGAISTNEIGITRWVVSFSHHYERFALIWDGEGEAVYQIGNGLERKPLGRSWNAASTINWGAAAITTTDVMSIAQKAVNRDGRTTVFIIPDNV